MRAISEFEPLVIGAKAAPPDAGLDERDPLTPPAPPGPETFISELLIPAVSATADCGMVNAGQFLP